MGKMVVVVVVVVGVVVGGGGGGGGGGFITLYNICNVFLKVQQILQFTVFDSKRIVQWDISYTTEDGTSQLF